MKKGDKIILIIVAAAAVFLFVSSFMITKSKDTDMVVISRFGEVLYTVPLKNDGEYIIDKGGHKNVVKIENGYVYMEKASCPDGLCIKQGKINSPSQTIVCLPNGIVIEIKSTDDGEFDSVAS